MTITIRGYCQVCKRRRRIRRDGKIRIHFRNEPFEVIDFAQPNPICFGSDALPLEMLTNEEDAYFCNTGCTGCRDMITYGI